MSLGNFTSADVQILRDLWEKGPQREFLERFPQENNCLVHRCNGCRNVIENSHPRFHCLDCDNFDYCVLCKNDSPTTHSGHLFKCFYESSHATDPRTYFNALRDEEARDLVSDNVEAPGLDSAADSLTKSEIFFTPDLYTPIDTSREEIRVISLLPGQDGEPVRCELIHVPVFGGIKYAALSYTCGVGPEDANIILNGSVLPVRLNLFEALVALRKRLDPFFIWIDAICIDQSNIDEKNMEVQRLRQIYAQADKVVIWLGSSSEDSDLAMNLINASTFGSAISMTHPGWPALDRLVRRRWWSRVWCIQELGLAHWSPVVMCGSRWTVWNQMVLATDKLPDYWASLTPQDYHTGALAHYVSFYGHDLTFQGLNSIRTQCTASVNLYLLYLLSVTLGYQATDPRDKVYGLLGICRPEDRDALVPDYAKTARELFIQTTEHFIKTSLNCFCFNINSPSNEEIGGRLPSWVSDWSLGASRPRPLWKQGIFSAGHLGSDKRILPLFTRAEDTDMLSVTGSELCTIKYVSEVISADDTWTSKNPRSLYRTIREIERFFAKQLANEAPPLSSLNIPVIWRTLIIDAELPQFAWISPASAKLGKAYGRLRRRAWDDLIGKESRSTRSSTPNELNDGLQSGTIQSGEEPRPLLPGWERKMTPTGRHYYVDHINNQTTWVDPRLLISCISGLRACLLEAVRRNSNHTTDTRVSMEAPETELKMNGQGSVNANTRDRSKDSESSHGILDEEQENKDSEIGGREDGEDAKGVNEKMEGGDGEGQNGHDRGSDKNRD